MAEIRPFRALRYTERAGDLSRLCCPPYDVISPEEQRALYEESPYNVVRLELGAGENRYADASALLSKWKEEGVLALDPEPAVYIYEEQFSLPGGERKVTRGFIARIMLTPFSAGVVLPHEETLTKAKEDRFRLMEATGCSFSQTYSLYEDEGDVVKDCLADAASREPDCIFRMKDGVTHRLWAVTDGEVVGAIQKAMRNKRVYIADGHHRYETAVAYRDRLLAEGRLAGADDPANFQMMAFVAMDDPGLVVLPTHRLIHGLPDFDGEALLASVASAFSARPVDGAEGIRRGLEQAGGKNVVGLYTETGAWLLTLTDPRAAEGAMGEKCAAYRSLDVAVLHRLILEPGLGIDKENMARQLNLSYTRDFDEACRAVRRGEAQGAFLLNATRVDQIRDVAAAGEKMPQKSTYFYPKLITGAVMNEFGIR